MADPSSMIASAVIVPEAVEQEQALLPTPIPTPTLKRRASSTLSDSTKRPRLTSESFFPSTTSTDLPITGSATTQPTNNARQKSKDGQEEERKRGKRLFGALLGTLSQKPSSAAQSRRAEIERKQQAKLREQAEEDDEKKRRRFEELMVARRVEQKRFDQQSMRVMHSNSLAMAHFLQTKAEPRLYYKPWDLLPHEKETIQLQIEEAQTEVDKEPAQSEPLKESTDEQLDGPGDAQEFMQEDTNMVGSKEPTADEPTTLTDQDTNNGAGLGEVEELADVEEMVVEAGEDQVIY